jgi:hypothetical protein
MLDLEMFRQDLAGLLHGMAEDRRRASGGRMCGEDLKIVALYHRLAREAATFDGAVYAACQDRLAPEPLARCFRDRRDDLLVQVGTMFWPKTADELVTWLTDQIVADRPKTATDGQAGEWASLRQPPPNRGRDRSNAPRQTFTASWGIDFCAGFGIVAPMLAVWEVRVGAAQWQDRALAHAHPAVAAHVASVETMVEGRSAATNVVLDFSPAPGAGSCRIMMRDVMPPLTVTPGQSLMVIPRSSDCEVPLVAARIGDPWSTFALAIALVAGGLVALKLWARLGRPRVRRMEHPVLP